ncbi:MAG: polysaccharide deacetylase [Butyricicoccus pullicaecorum]|nr:polysaccharide deacetylase [Butyricicoccus pullicaecorum]
MRYRHSSYYSSRYRHRRMTFGEVIRIILLILIVGMIGFGTFMVYRAVHAEVVLANLKKQNEVLSQTVARYQAVMPDPALTGAAEPLPYQTLYPEMRVAQTPEVETAKRGTVFLTFEGGPSQHTATILDALKKSGAHATFFVTGKNIAGNEALVKRMVDEGHTIGVSSYSGDYKAIYLSPDAFVEDFHQAYEAIYAACGVYPTIFRFPGGSVNRYSQNTYQPIIAEMLRRGFLYYDWSASANDAESGNRTITEVTQTVLAGVQKTKNTPVVLMHDTAEDTARAMGNLLSELKKAGYTCEALNNTVRPVTFAYPN